MAFVSDIRRRTKQNFHCEYNLDVYYGYFWIREYYRHQTNSNDNNNNNNIEFHIILNRKPIRAVGYFWLHEKFIFFPTATVDLPFYPKQHRHFIFHIILQNISLSFFFGASLGFLIHGLNKHSNLKLQCKKWRKIHIKSTNKNRWNILNRSDRFLSEYLEYCLL